MYQTRTNDYFIFNVNLRNQYYSTYYIVLCPQKNWPY